MQSYLNWPGKSAVAEGLPEHPAVYHMLDVAAVAEVLIAPFDLPKPLSEALILLTALHDLGKIGEPFRAMLREGRVQPWRHWQITEALLRHQDAAMELQLGSRWQRRFLLYAAAAGHHGKPPSLSETDLHRALHVCGAVAVHDAGAVISDLCALWPDASLADLGKEQAVALSWWLPGLVTAADWIGSNTCWFPAVAAGPSAAEYLVATRERAVKAVRSAGMQGVGLADRTLFDFALRPMQKACAEISLPDGPTLAVIEDETGAGKTEAALILAQRMMAAGKGRGLFFALPTMATADAMFARAADVVGRMFTSAPSVTLAHGRSTLSEKFREILNAAPGESDDITCSPWLAETRRKALLADVGVGTVDQALLAALPTRFNTLRHFGLSSKILIVDEVHEIGQPYMAEVLEQVLRLHRGAGGSAILLTATLPLELRQRLLAVYDGKAKNSLYPALSLSSGASKTDLPQATGARGPVRVERLGGMAEAVLLLADRARQGAACAWVRNAVDDAIAAVHALRDAGVEAELLHARFALTDRKRIEGAALDRFGKDGQGRAGKVLVATQVIESSLDLDFDVMVSDLAPMAALVQRAGRLWRHMALRPQTDRPVPAPVLHVVSPDPAQVTDAQWLNGVLDRGAFVYPHDLQWRTADHLFRVGEIVAPSGLRSLIEAVHGEGLPPVPEPLDPAQTERVGTDAAKSAHAWGTMIRLAEGYRDGGQAADDADYPTRLGIPQRVLRLARCGAGGLTPWAEGRDGWALSEVTASRTRLDALPLPDQTAPEIAALMVDWPEWKRAETRICPVGEGGLICEGLRYDADLGLLFSSPDKS